jgi:hypothetical protein
VVAILDGVLLSVGVVDNGVPVNVGLARVAYPVKEGIELCTKAVVAMVVLLTPVACVTAVNVEGIVPDKFAAFSVDVLIKSPGS